MVFSRFILFILPLLLYSCGVEELSKQFGAQPIVVKASAFEKSQGLALPESYIVSFRQTHEKHSFATYSSEYRSNYSFFADPLWADPGIKEIEYLSSYRSEPKRDEFQNPSTQLVSEPFSSQTGGIIFRVDFSDAESSDRLLREWEQGGKILLAEPNYISKLSQNIFETYAEEYDSLSEFWWFDQINLAEAFNTLANRDQSDPDIPDDAYIQSHAPVIAVLDSGVDYLHPALQSKMWHNENPNEIGCVDDLYGCRTTSPKKGSLGDGEVHPYDSDGPNLSCLGRDSNCSHGTHVAGLIAGDHTWDGGELGQKVAGVCPVCKILPLKIVGKVGEKSGILDSSIIRAFKYISMIRRGNSSEVRIANCSFGKFVRSRHVSLLIRLLKEKRSTLVIAAAGNEDTLTMEYPAAFPDAVAVAALTSGKIKGPFSNFGHWVDISAPGAKLLSTVPGGLSAYKSGTSMASPIVAGVAGLMLARFPTISFDDHRNWLLHSADPGLYSEEIADGFNYWNYYPRPKDASIRIPLLGFGLLSANAALLQSTSQRLPIYPGNARVKAGCSTVLVGKRNCRVLWPLLFAPILLVGFPLLKRRREKFV